MDDSFSFGLWVRRRRKALDLTQVALAARVGCAESMLRKIEADTRRPSRQIAERLAQALELSPAEREAFLRAARGELTEQHLAMPTQPALRPTPTELVQAPLPAQFISMLPIPPTPLIGRDEDVAGVRDRLFANQTRLLNQSQLAQCPRF